MKYALDKVDAVVLAGGINRIPLFDGNTPGYKALLTLGNKPLIEYPLDSLRSVITINRICIVGPPGLTAGAISDPGLYEYEPAGDALVDSISAGLEHFKNSEIVLFTTADLPLLTPEAVTDFIEACRSTDTPYETNIFWAMVPEESFTGAFQKSGKSSFNRFRDIAVCHGNLLLMTPSVVQNRRLAKGMRKIYERRGSSVLSALAFGVLTGLTYFFGVHIFRILTLRQFAFIFSKSLKMGLIPVIHRRPETAVDIDRPENYRFVCEQLKSGKVEIA